MKRLLAVVLATIVSSLAAPKSPKPEYTSFAEARPVLEAMAGALPEGLSGLSKDRLEAAWPAWVRRRDGEIRTRLEQGEEDTIINFMLFGMSFTHQNRVSGELWERLRRHQEALPAGKGKDDGFQQTVPRRMENLIEAASHPGENERLRSVRGLLLRKGCELSTAEGKNRARRYLTASLSRVLTENASYASVLRAARSLGDSTEEFAQRSSLFRTRGLSLDTSWPVNFALEECLAAIAARNLLTPGSVRRVAIIGPGLDFTDKQEGYDFYPQQTIQVFAVYDSLLRLGLARRDSLSITTLDLSRRVNEHLAQARARQPHGIGYTVQLPLESDVEWTKLARKYWEHFGDQTGTQTKPVPVPAVMRKVKMRAVRIRPSVVQGIEPLDLNIVLQELDTTADPDARFDLIIATNVLVYYDVFEQSLALGNVARMLKPGGFLLSNNALLELPGSTMRSLDYTTTPYSSRANDGDRIVWYRHEADAR